MQKVRVAVVGTGFAADFHMHAYATVPQAEVVAIAEIVRERGEAFAKKYGIPDVYTDYHDLLQRNDIHLVDVTTPVHVHAPVVIDAARAGKHVVCEKPLAAYCGEDRPDIDLVGNELSRREMYAKAVANADTMLRAVDENGV